jgi:transposase
MSCNKDIIFPADYKKEYEWLKEVDSLALSNAQLHLDAAYITFFRTPCVGFPKFNSKHCSLPNRCREPLYFHIGGI